MMDQKRAKELMDRYLDGTATPEERLLFEQLSNQVTKRRLQYPEADQNEALYNRLPRILSGYSASRFRILTAAAAVLICVSSVAIFYPHQKHQATELISAITPGENQAILTLANGKRIKLTAAGDGQLAEESGIRIRKTRLGQLIYEAEADNETATAGYNMTETPKGGQYRLQLADGTKVWLNSSSSLKYPTRFGGKERHVELSGEAYFEVAHNTDMPFKVSTRKQVVTVLGTHFNINAYSDEPSLKTTLLQGKVRINTLDSKMSAILRPGEQATLKGTGLRVTTGDTEEAVAWKNGYFRFRGEDIHSVMRKLSRWYNIDVSYAKSISNDGYYGTVSRDKNIDQVLAVLTETGSVHFKIQGRRIMVMK